MIVPGSCRPSRLHSMFTASHQCTIASRAKLLGRAACVLLFSYSFLAISVWGADAPLPFSYTQRLWQMQDGLPEQVVQAFAQTANRYLWIGTTGGLVQIGNRTSDGTIRATRQPAWR